MTAPEDLPSPSARASVLDLDALLRLPWDELEALARDRGLEYDSAALPEHLARLIFDNPKPSAASRRAKSNRDKGNTTERDLAKWLRTWYPEAERSVAAGFKVASDSGRGQDRGDIRDACVPEHPIVWQVKNVTGSHPNGLAGKALVQFLVACRQQRDAAKAELGLLVEKRSGHASPAAWFVHLDARELAALIYRRFFPCTVAPHEGARGPVRMLLGDLMPILVRAGFAPVPVTEEPTA